MKSKIILLNCMKYGKEGSDKKPTTRIEFAFTDVKDEENYFGSNVISTYVSGHAAFNKLNPDMVFKVLDAEFDIKEDYYNPLATRKILKSINGINLK